MESKNITPDEFTILLRAFNSLVAMMPPIDKIKQDLLAIKTSANNSNELNASQKDAITARVDNYLDGTYGNTKSGVSFSSPQDNKK